MGRRRLALAAAAGERRVAERWMRERLCSVGIRWQPDRRRVEAARTAGLLLRRGPHHIPAHMSVGVVELGCVMLEGQWCGSWRMREEGNSAVPLTA